MECNLKPFIATQRVRPPPGKGVARQPEASLAWAAATALVKRRQRAAKPCHEPRNHACRSLRRVGCGGSTGKAVTARNTGSGGVLEQGRAAGRAAREPERSRPCPYAERRKVGVPAEQRSRPGAALTALGARKRARNLRGRTDSGGEDISQRTHMAGSRSGFIVPRMTGNRARRDPAEGRETPRMKTH